LIFEIICVDAKRLAAGYRVLLQRTSYAQHLLGAASRREELEEKKEKEETLS